MQITKQLSSEELEVEDFTFSQPMEAYPNVYDAFYQEENIGVVYKTRDGSWKYSQFSWKSRQISLDKSNLFLEVKAEESPLFFSRIEAAEELFKFTKAMEMVDAFLLFMVKIFTDSESEISQTRSVDFPLKEILEL